MYTAVTRSIEVTVTPRFLPDGIYGPLETTLQQFNVWLLEKYRAAMAS